MSSPPCTTIPINEPRYRHENVQMYDLILRICLDFTVNMFFYGLFGLFEVIFGTFTLSVLANRPLFAASRERKSAQKSLSTKLEIKSKQILNYEF